MKPRVAILGAGGFIGSRIVEAWHLGREIEVRPVVRNPAGLARSARFRLDHRLADAMDQASLRRAFEGCEAVVHAISGDPQTITGSVVSAYRAADESGVRRFIYLSSASVHGQAPVPGTDETTPLAERQEIPYNGAKIRAERKLLRLRSYGRPEIVILRPGIVFGPRSSWVGGFADEVLTGKAYVVNGARGICNSIYVDNLVQAVYLSLYAPGIDGQAFLIGDAERVLWCDLYRPIAEALGFTFADIPSVAWTGTTLSLAARIAAVRKAAWVRAVVPLRLRRAVGSGLAAWMQSASVRDPWAVPHENAPVATLERALLQQCTYKLPFAKAARMLGYSPHVSFDEGCRRSLLWLAFAGYPVKGATAGSRAEEYRTSSSS